MTDHHEQAAVREAAVREVARLLEPHIADSVRNGVAARIIARLHDLGWRPIPRTPAIERQAAGSPPPPEWRRVADKIRARAGGSGDG